MKLLKTNLFLSIKKNVYFLAYSFTKFKSYKRSGEAYKQLNHISLINDVHCIYI